MNYFQTFRFTIFCLILSVSAGVNVLATPGDFGLNIVKGFTANPFIENLVPCPLAKRATPAPPSACNPTHTSGFSPRVASPTANLKADYQLQGNLNSSVAGAPAMTDLGSGNSFVADTVDGVGRQSLRFPQNNGLTVSTAGLIQNNNYTIVVLFKFDDLSGFRKIIDFANGTTDNGLYINNGIFEHENIPGSPRFFTGTYAQVVVVRESSGLVRQYRNGVLADSRNDGGDYLITAQNRVGFFQDDAPTNGTESSAGNVARIRIYDGPLTNAEVLALDRLAGATPTPTPTPPQAATYIVTDTAGSLLVAILNANSNPGADTIIFSIPTSDPGYDSTTGVWTITPGANGLPTITDPVTIDATTQPGYLNRPVIELNGSNINNRVALLGITAGNCVVRGLAINRMRGHGIKLATLGGNRIERNFIGIDAGGSADRGNRDAGVDIENSSNNLIGGSTSTARNVISGNDVWGISISGTSANNRIQGNFIGTNRDGTSALGNANGVQVVGSNNNTIGLNADGTGAGNSVAFNNGLGVWIHSGTGNRISGNSIFLNAGLGINLGSDGVTDNDPGDDDTGANNLQNFPMLTSASSANATTTIQGTLNSTPNTDFKVEFYSSQTCNSPSNTGVGETFLGSTTLTTDSSGNRNFTDTSALTFQIAVAIGRLITATATDPAGNTSEFSACMTVTNTS
ncbi:MAG: hypothetical protein ABIV48_10310, partial [Pyrinomonadaceae bacterium]